MRFKMKLRVWALLSVSCKVIYDRARLKCIGLPFFFAEAEQQMEKTTPIRIMIFKFEGE